MKSESTILLSENPMVIVQGNTFKNLTTSDYGVVELGGYISFGTLSMQYYLTTNQAVNGKSPSVIQFSPFPEAEAITFRQYQKAQAIFNSTRASISQYNAQNSVYFIVLQNNTFDSIDCRQATYLTDFENFEVTNGSVAIFQNAFSNLILSSQVTGGGANDFYLIQGKTISIFILSNMSISNFSDSSTLLSLSLSSDYIANLLIDSNTFTSNQNLAAFEVSAIRCGSILINNTQAQDLLLDKTFISVSC